MKITICGSIGFLEKMYDIQKQLICNKNTVYIPEEDEQYKIFYKNNARIDKEHYFTKRHLEKIKKSDAILVVNEKKNDIQGYIGIGTIIELAYAFALNKSIFILHPLDSKHVYYAEILALNLIS